MALALAGAQVVLVLEVVLAEVPGSARPGSWRPGTRSPDSRGVVGRPNRWLIMVAVSGHHLHQAEAAVAVAMSACQPLSCQATADQRVVHLQLGRLGRASTSWPRPPSAPPWPCSCDTCLPSSMSHRSRRLAVARSSAALGRSSSAFARLTSTAPGFGVVGSGAGSSVSSAGSTMVSGRRPAAARPAPPRRRRCRRHRQATAAHQHDPRPPAAASATSVRSIDEAFPVPISTAER